MSRPARFSRDQIVAAAAEVVAEHGPAGSSIARIAGALKAPTGSIYHRFGARDLLLGTVWLRAAESFQQAFGKRLDGPDPKAAGLCAVRWLPQRVRERPQEARILLLHRREDFLESRWPATMTARAMALQTHLHDGLHQFSQRLVGRSDEESLCVIRFAVIEAPLAAVRRHVQANEPPPATVDTLIEATYLATIELAGAKP